MSHRRVLAGLVVVGIALVGIPVWVLADGDGAQPTEEKPADATVPFRPPSQEANDKTVPQTGNTSVRQEPAVCLEWIGPTNVQTGRPAEYTLSVKNLGNTAAQQVLVRVQIPAGARVTETEPAATSENDVIWWELGTLAVKQQKNLLVRMVADTRGELACNSWVTFTGSAAMKLKVTEPKLALKITPPEKSGVGDAATFLFLISNPGDGMAENVKIHATLSDGLEHPAGKQIDFDVGNLPPREARTIRLVCLAKIGGEHKCDAVVDGAGDLRARDRSTFNVTMPKLDVQVAGPKLRYLDRKAVYSFKVHNPGDGTAHNVTLTDVIPAGFKFQAASDGGLPDSAAQTVSWSLGEVAPGQAKEVKLEVVAVSPGEHHHKLTALGARGLKANSEITTRVEGLSSLALEILESDNPVEVGTEVCYEIRVINNGSKTETDIKLVAVIPDQMMYKNASGPARSKEEGKEVVFEPLPKLDPGADAIYRVTVTAASAGDARFKAKLTSAGVSDPVIQMMATRVYQD